MRNPSAPARPHPADAADPIPDPAFDALPRLAALRDALRRAARLPPPGPRWNVPPLFFFDRARQAEWDAARPPEPPPAADELADRIADLLPALFASVEARHAARAVPELRDAATAVAGRSPAARGLADLLAVPDDEALVVLDPASHAGFRFYLRGVADVGQLHVLLADELPGRRPGRHVVTACRDADPAVPAGVPLVAEARFQFFHPSALLPGGTLPPGFRGSDHWLWNHQPAATVPRIDGERVVLVGEPAFATTWEVDRRFPQLAATLTPLDTLTPVQVRERLAKLCGHPVAAPAAGPERLRPAA